MNFGTSIAAQLTRNLTDVVVDFVQLRVQPPESAIRFYGSEFMRLAKNVHLPQLTTLSLHMDEDEYATLPPIHALYVMGHAAILPPFDQTHLQLLILHDCSATLVGNYPALTTVVCNADVNIDLATLPNMYTFIGKTDVRSLLGMPGLKVLRLNDDERNDAAIREYTAVHGQIHVCPARLATRVGAMPFVYQVNQTSRGLECLILNWSPEFGEDTTEIEDDIVYEPAEGLSVARDAAEEPTSDEEIDAQECPICVEPMKHPRSPFGCGHFICHVCASVQLCPFCRKRKA